VIAPLVAKIACLARPGPASSAPHEAAARGQRVFHRLPPSPGSAGPTCSAPGKHRAGCSGESRATGRLPGGTGRSRPGAGTARPGTGSRVPRSRQHGSLLAGGDDVSGGGLATALVRKVPGLAAGRQLTPVDNRRPASLWTTGRVATGRDRSAGAATGWTAARIAAEGMLPELSQIAAVAASSSPAGAEPGPGRAAVRPPRAREAP
jgi:hypothetical protein